MSAGVPSPRSTPASPLGASPSFDRRFGTLNHPRQTMSVNKNVEWINGRGAWTFYIVLLLLGWLISCYFTDPGMAWTYVHLAHGVATYFLLHWFKGSPIDIDQGKYDKLTFWEQMDDGVQNTGNRKFFTAVPIILFLLATHGSDFRRQPLGLNLLVVIVLVVAKVPGMHKVRILGINKY